MITFVRKKRCLLPADQLITYMQLYMYREYRDHVKDLSCISKDLCRIVIVDNNPFSFLLQPLNGIPCIPFSPGQPHDDQVNMLIIPIKIKTRNLSLTSIDPMMVFALMNSSWLSSSHCSSTYLSRVTCDLCFMKDSACLTGSKSMESLPSLRHCKLYRHHRQYWSCHSLYNSSKPENNRKLWPHCFLYIVWEALVSARDPKFPFSRIQLLHPLPYLWTSTCMCYVESIHVIFCL